MTQKTGYIIKILSSIFILFVPLIFSGCGPKPTLATYMQPELLYLKEAPYSSLYVEIDTVEGAEVPDEWLDVLKEFLSSHCSKPDGIRIVRDEPIPLDEIRDLQIGPASIVCIDGPDPLLSPQPAYLHVFFYNWKKTFKKAELASHIISNCPNTIFFPTDKIFQKDIAPCTLQHEAGHILGLCKETSHGDGAHCKNYNCLMNSSPGFLSDFGLLFGIPVDKSLCDDCLDDLENYKSESTDPNLAFNGPFLIRKEGGYSVALLPYCYFIIPQFLEEKFKWSELLKSINDMSRGIDDKKYWKDKENYWIGGIFTPNNEDGSPPDIDLLKESLAKASEDPDNRIKQLAAAEPKKLEQKK